MSASVFLPHGCRSAFLALTLMPALLFAQVATEPPAALLLSDTAETKWRGEVHEIIDASTGLLCLEYRKANPQGEAVLSVDFPAPGLEHYDALELEWKLMAEDANVVVSLEGDPATPLRRYYLRKRPNPVGQWQKAYLKLNQDDDGASIPALADLPDAPPAGTLRLKIALTLRDLKGADAPVLQFRFARPRLVRYPVTLSGSYASVVPLEEKGIVGQRYTLTLKNRTAIPQSVHLAADQARLPPFSLTLPTQPIALKAGEEKTIQADLHLPADEAAALSPLTSGSAQLFAWTESEPELKTTWFDSYFINALIASVPPAPRPAPRFISEAERTHALEKIQAEPKARALFEKLEKEANEWLTCDITPPQLIHGYSGFYVCREHSSPLDYRSPESHWCRKGEHLIEGDDQINRAGAYQQHTALSHAALTLARIGWLKADPRYSRKAADILLGYAAIYPQLPFVSSSSTGYRARVAHAVLGECWWFDPIPYAFDLVEGAGVLKTEEAAQIRRDLLLPAILAIRSHRNAANQQAETNHAVGLGALAAAHWPLASEAMDGELGLRFQWREDFDPDGMSVEHELPYHFAAVKPFAQMAAVYQTYGLNLYSEAFRQLFAAPIDYSSESLPASYSAIYESILSAWPEPRFMAQAANHRQGNWSWAALINQVDPPEQTPPLISNSTLSASGTTTLRAPLSNGGVAAVSMNFGSSAWRSGKALLDPLITWNGLPLNQRILRIGYGYEGSAFSYTPAAGNGLLIDGKGGSMLRAEQVAILSGPVPAARWVSPLHRPHFPGVHWARSAAIIGDSILILDQFSAKQPRRFDLISYFPMPFTSELPAATPYPGLIEEGDGYQYLRTPRQFTTAPTLLRYPLGPKSNAPEGSVFLQNSPSTTFIAEAQAEWHPRLIPALIRRFEGNTGWAITLYNAAPTLDTKPHVERLPAYTADGTAMPPHEAIGLRISTPNGDLLLLAADSDGTFTIAQHPLKGPLAVLPLSP